MKVCTFSHLYCRVLENAQKCVVPNIEKFFCFVVDNNKNLLVLRILGTWQCILNLLKFSRIGHISLDHFIWNCLQSIYDIRNSTMTDINQYEIKVRKSLNMTLSHQKAFENDFFASVAFDLKQFKCVEDINSKKLPNKWISITDFFEYC